jgi:hypothetical protein
MHNNLPLSIYYGVVWLHCSSIHPFGQSTWEFEKRNDVYSICYLRIHYLQGLSDIRLTSDRSSFLLVSDQWWVALLNSEKESTDKTGLTSWKSKVLDSNLSWIRVLERKCRDNWTVRHSCFPWKNVISKCLQLDSARRPLLWHQNSDLMTFSLVWMTAREGFLLSGYWKSSWQTYVHMKKRS